MSSEGSGNARRILVIKLGALGDFIQALGPIQAIRRHHAGASITLLTTAPFAGLARACPWIDEVWVDERPPWWRLGQALAMRRRLRDSDFAFVYDLQTSDRSGFYFRLMGPGRRPAWSGIASGCSHPHDNPDRDRMHTLDRQAEQLRMAGIAAVPPPDLSWLEADLTGFALPDRFALLAPGGAAHRPEKRWPIEGFAKLARWLVGEGLTPVVLGTEPERALASSIVTAAPTARDLTGRTSFAEIAALARRARAAIGNDTGPMHLIAAAGSPAVVLFGPASDPALCAPRGERVRIVRAPALDGLGLEAVLQPLLTVLAPA